LLVLFGSLIGSIGMVFLKKASAHLHKGFLHIISINAAAGVTLFLISSLFYLKAISHGQLSVLYPMVSLSYVWTQVWAGFSSTNPSLARSSWAWGWLWRARSSSVWEVSLLHPLSASAIGLLACVDAPKAQAGFTLV
jgi:hypothetical protein